MKRFHRSQCIVATILLFASGGCATSVTEASHVNLGETIKAQQAGKYTNADFVYFLPRSLLKVEFTPNSGQLDLTEIAVRDEQAAFAVRKERAFENQGNLTLSEYPGGTNNEGAGDYDPTGLIQHISFTTSDTAPDDPKLTESSQKLRERITELEAKLDAREEEAGQAPKTDDAAGGGVQAIPPSLRGGGRAVLVDQTANGATATKPSAPAVSAFCDDSALFAPSGCILQSSDGMHQVTLKAQRTALADGLPGDVSNSSTSCAKRAICFRRKVAVPVNILIKTCKTVPPSIVQPHTTKRLVHFTDGSSNEDDTSEKQECVTAAGSQIVQIVDRRVNYGVELKGKRFVGVTTTVAMKDGEVVTFTDNRPSAVNSIAKAPYNLVTDVVGATITLIIAIIP